jgi:hypothetical protein
MRDPIAPVSPGTVPARGAILRPIQFERTPITPLPEVHISNSEIAWRAWDMAVAAGVFFEPRRATA